MDRREKLNTRFARRGSCAKLDGYHLQNTLFRARRPAASGFWATRISLSACSRVSLGSRREESHGAQDFAPHPDAIYSSPVIDHGRVKFPSQKLPF